MDKQAKGFAKEFWFWRGLCAWQTGLCRNLGLGSLWWPHGDAFLSATSSF